MKILNRPMFRYGGPIKEGIMSGIKEPRQGYQDAGSVFKNVQAVLQDGTAADPKVLNEAAKLGIGNPYRVQEFKPYMKKVVTKPKIDMSETDQLAAEVEQIDPVEPLTELQKAKIGKTFIGTEEYRQKVKELEALEEANKLKSKADGTVTTQGKSPFAYTLDEVIENKGKTDSVDDDPPPPTKKEKVNSILEGLGYDRAQKNALYDAMIKAGQRISRTGLGADNLVSDVIAETSQSYDKPEKLREAANLMQVQQDLKLDQIKASKDTEGTLEKNAKYLLESGAVDNAKDAVLSAQGKATEANDIFFEASQKLNSSKALDQTALTLGARGKFGEGIVFKNKVPKKYKGEPIEKFLDSGAFRGDGLYTADGKIMLIQDGKIKSELIIRGSIEEGLFSFGGDD
jgi:hypothetical protein